MKDFRSRSNQTENYHSICLTVVETVFTIVLVCTRCANAVIAAQVRLTKGFSPQQRSRDVYDPDGLTMRQAERVDQHRDQCATVNHEGSFSEKPTFMYTCNCRRQPIKRSPWESRTLPVSRRVCSHLGQEQHAM